MENRNSDDNFSALGASGAAGLHPEGSEPGAPERGPAAEAGGVPVPKEPRSRVDRAREQEVLDHVRHGRRDVALKILMVVYGDFLASFLLRLVHDPEQVKDLCQDVFLQVYLGIHKFEGRNNSSIWSWLCGIAYFRFLDARKKQRGREAALTPVDFDVLDQLLGSPDSMMDDERLAMRRRLERCLAKVPEQMRARLMMRWYLGLSHAEIGEAVGADVSAVQVSISRIQVRVRECLRGRGEA